MNNSTFLKNNACACFSIFKLKNQKSIKYLGSLMLFVFMGFSANSQCISWMGGEYTSLGTNYLGDNVLFEIQSYQPGPNQGAQVYIDWGNDGYGFTQNIDWYNLPYISAAGSNNKWNANVIMRQTGTHNRRYLGYNGCNGDYVTANLGTFIVSELSDPTSPIATIISASQIDLSWSQWNTKDVIVVRRSTSAAASTAPTQGSVYVQGNSLGTGTVVYNGTGTGFSDTTGLISGVGYTYIFYSVNNNYYSAGTTAVVKWESTIAVTGATSFIYDNTPQGPSAADVTGSTGAVTYTYVGVSPTIYAVNAIPPTNPGTYIVTATVASDDNYNEASSMATPFAIGASTYISDANFLQALIAAPYNVGNKGNYVLTSNISGLTTLNVAAKGISNLTGIEAFSSLQDLYCADNALTNLNVSMLSNLRFLDCQSNSLTSLNITGLNNLTQMVCWVNNLTTLDLSSTPNLVYLDCDDNAFTSLDVSKLPNLIQFYCSGNQLTSLDVRGLTNLANFECTDNLSLTCILVDNVAAAVLKTTTIDNDNVPPSPFWKKDATATYSYCGCSLPLTTWNGATWNNGAPTSTQDALITGDYSEAAAILACSLTINNNAVVVIPSGTNVTLNAPITITSGSFTLSNNANLVQTNKNSINAGTINVKRNSSPLFRSDYTIWSSPVTGAQTLGGFSPLTSVAPIIRFYNYDEATNFYTIIANPSTTAFAKGSGYLIRMPNEDPSNLGGGTLYSLGTATVTYNGVFTGVPNNGDVPVTLNYVDAAHGYNMVGNPYPSTIDANKFITDNAAKIESTLYFWRKTNAASGSAYASYTAGGGTTVTPTSEIPNGTIQVGQGFFVQAKSVGSIANFFTNEMRLGTSSTQFFKTKKVVEKNRVWLNLTNATGVFSQALVAYITDATPGVDVYDGKYINDSPIALTSNINNEEYTIQGRPTFDAADVVALNFKTNLASDYTIAIDHVDGLFSGSQDVFLNDNNTGTETNLKAGSYTFTAVAGVDNARFSLKYQRTLGVNNTVFNDESVMIHKNKGTLYVNSGSTAINNIKVFDIQGRLIAEQKNVKSNTATIKDLKATQQVVIIKITSQDNKVVSKKVVN